MSDTKDEARPLAELADEMRELGHEAFVEKHGRLFLCFNTSDVRLRASDSTTLEPQPVGGAQGGETAPTVFWILPLKSEDGGDRVTVGRDDACDVTLIDQSISTRHAVFHIDGDQVTLQDAGSKNGTYLSDQLIPREGAGDPVVLEGERASLRFGSLSVVLFRLPALIEAARMLGHDPGDG